MSLPGSSEEYDSENGGKLQTTSVTEGHDASGWRYFLSPQHALSMGGKKARSKSTSGGSGDTDLLDEAVEYCVQQNVKGFAAVRRKKFKQLNPKAIGKKLKARAKESDSGGEGGGGEASGVKRPDQRILVDQEEADLINWLQDCNSKGDGQSREQIGAHIVTVLEHRQRQRVRCKGTKYQPLSPAALACIKNGGPSHKWFRSFYQRHASLLHETVQQTEDAQRVQNQRESVVEEHFYGPYGLHNELVAAQEARRRTRSWRRKTRWRRRVQRMRAQGRKTMTRNRTRRVPEHS